LSTTPDVLILDEPTIGLDPKQIIEVRELIRELGEERTVILSSHILPEVKQICDRVLIISRGHLVAADTPERLSARFQGMERVLVKLQNPGNDAAEQFSGISGVSAVEPTGDNDNTFEIECAVDVDRRAEVAAVAVQNGWGLLELRSVGASLEDVFLQLTAEEAETEEGGE